MPSKSDLLIEIGTEELPPKSLAILSDAFTREIVKQFQQLDLSHEAVKSYATPRRLAVLIESLVTSQNDKQIERRGPALQAAYDKNKSPTKAALGFAGSCGVTVDELEQLTTEKGSWLIYRQVEKGLPTKELIPGIVEKSLAGLPIPKRMRWGSGSEEFVRPVHWILIIFGSDSIQGELLGLTISNQTYGHRFHHPHPITIQDPKTYSSLLKSDGYVIADYEERKALIKQMAQKAISDKDGHVEIDEDLLEEVTALTEWPVPIVGSFENRFLDIPKECLVQAMQGHQKYFPITNDKGELLPFFITIANIESNDIEQVRKGNERVIRPRFSDAVFFWQQDLKHPLESHIESLKSIKFQDKLGSLHDKSGRIAALSDEISEQIGFDKALSMRAAWLCKCDLMTEMVGEFANLQGTMGRYYAQHSGEHPEVVQAMEEIYLPRFAGDELPKTDCGRTLAIADRIDTLMGIFAIGQKPTGAKDPYGLRRAALGVIRILIETPIDIDLKKLLESAAEKLSSLVNATQHVDETFDYIMERIRYYYLDQGISHEYVDAVSACKPTRPSDFDQRLRALIEFKNLPEAETLAAANKRIRNILKKSTDEVPAEVVSERLSDTAEISLALCISELTPKVNPLFENREYTEGLKILSALKEPVDQFFDQVMVMVDDDNLRRNRLAILTKLENLFLRVADFSRLQ